MKNFIRKHSVSILIILLVLSGVGIATYNYKYARHYPEVIDLRAKPNFWGVTYSKRFASQLKLNWKEVYTAILDDMGADHIRLPIYWNDVEPKQGKYFFEDYDWMIEEAYERDVKVIPVVGFRQPRWPECHQPRWANSLSREEFRKELLAVIEKTVNRYKENDNILYWQVENEPFLDSFGECPPSDEDLLKAEINLVKNLDNRPVLITASGELSDWEREKKIGDKFGTTIYRVVWNPWLGYLRYPTPSNYYLFKAKEVGLRPGQAIIAELQAEPWAPNTTLDNLPLHESYKSFTLEQMEANLQFAIDTSFGQAYLWGVEWWYLQKQKGHPEYWNLAKTLDW